MTIPDFLCSQEDRPNTVRKRYFQRPLSIPWDSASGFLRECNLSCQVLRFDNVDARLLPERGPQTVHASFCNIPLSFVIFLVRKSDLKCEDGGRHAQLYRWRRSIVKSLPSMDSQNSGLRASAQYSPVRSKRAVEGEYPEVDDVRTQQGILLFW